MFLNVVAAKLEWLSVLTILESSTSWMSSSISCLKRNVFNMRQSPLNFKGLLCFLNCSSGTPSWPTVDYNAQPNTELAFKSGPRGIQIFICLAL